MSSKPATPARESLEWVVWFSELPARVSWQMVKDALKTRVNRGIRNVRHGGPRFISADVGTPDNGKRLFDEIARSGIDGLEDCSFTIAWGYVVRGARVYSMKYEERKYFPPRIQRHLSYTAATYLSAPMTQTPEISHLQTPLICSNMMQPSSELATFSKCLSVIGLPVEMTSAKAEQFFSRYGDVVACRVNPPSECRIQYRYAGDAQNAAQSLHNQWLNGHRLLIRFHPLPSQRASSIPTKVFEVTTFTGAQDGVSSIEDTIPQIENAGGVSISSQYIDISGTTIACKHEDRSSPLTDADGRSIVGYRSIRSEKRRQIVSRRSSTDDSRSENDMSH